MNRAVVLAFALAACGGGRILSGPVVGTTVSVAPRLARLEQGVLEILLEIDNRTDSDIRIEPTRAALVGPDGTLYPESGGPRWYRLSAHSHRRIRVRFADLDWKLEHAPGFYLRLDGFVLADAGAITIPALPLGHPVADADGKVRIRRVITATAAPPDTRCAILPLGDPAVEAALRERLEAAGWTVVATEDHLASDARAEAALCAQGECIRELGGALGVAYLVAGSVTEAEGEKVLTLRLMNVASGEVTARANALVLVGQGEDPGAAFDGAVEALVGLD